MSNYANFELVAINNYSYKPPKSDSSKLINTLADMGYTDIHQANKAIEKYLKTGKIAKPRKGQ
jgi:hypothetical protein